MDLNGLNREQKEAVMHIDGPMLVLAGERMRALGILRGLPESSQLSLF